MTTKNIVFMLLYGVLGGFIGILALRYYLDGADSNLFYAILCIAITVVLSQIIAKKTQDSIAFSVIILILILLLRKPAAWTVVWLVCAIKAIFSIIWWILTIVGSILVEVF